MQFDSSPRIVFGKEQKPVLKSKGKSVFLKSAGTSSQVPSCPKGCKGKVWQQGHWKKHLYEIQRWMCCECGYIFSDPKQLKEANKKLQRVETIESMELKSPRDIDSNCQIRVKETKNLGAEEKTICIPQKHEKRRPQRCSHQLYLASETTKLRRRHPVRLWIQPASTHKTRHRPIRPPKFHRQNEPAWRQQDKHSKI